MNFLFPLSNLFNSNVACPVVQDHAIKSNMIESLFVDKISISFIKSNGLGLSKTFS